MASRLPRGQRRVVLVAIAVAFIVSLGGGVAFAAEGEAPVDMDAIQEGFAQLQAAPVIQQNCNFCHANISETDNYASEIKFTHANHILVQCSACHSKFPHRPEGTSRPTMKGCFDCHGMQHGPAGEMATGKCEDCHQTAKTNLRPAFHLFNWSGKPHVEPANEEFNKRCAMCHTPETCNDCHEAEGIEWTPAKWEFDSMGGCQSCHGSSLLMKQALNGGKSFQVTGLDDSTHANLTCQDCHIDYRYDQKPAPTKLWTINASYGCSECHSDPNTGDPARDKKLAAPVAEYAKSTHAVAISEGKLDSATCGSCHGGHFIYRLDSPTNKQRLHESSYRVCARCKQHGKDYDTYDDYYHGKAYKKGAPDSPACWNCHGSHFVLGSDDPKSTVYPKNTAKTCGQEGCHKGSNEDFGTDAAQLIHQQVQAEKDNPLLKLIGNLTGR